MRISLEDAINRLKHGEVVAIPTETVYGLAADAKNVSALQQIYQIKQRPADNPLIVHIADKTQVNDWAVVFPLLAQKFADAFWPGPFTMVLNAQTHVSKILTAGQSTVALRVPNHPLTLQLLKESGLSLAAPSANKYTQLSPTTPAHVETGLGSAIPVLDGGACHVGIESTIVHVFQDQQDRWQWQLLRPGMVSEASIMQVAGMPQSTLKQVKATLDKSPSDFVTEVKVPGQHLLHYSPRTPLQSFANRVLLLEKAHDLMANNMTCAGLLLGDGVVPNCPVEVMSNKPEEYAAALYRALHALDALGVDQLLVEMPPNTPQWIPVLDRLNRATHQ
jgi:L-threonylcarbamoyladenylate synthase